MGLPGSRARDRPRCTVRTDDGSETPSLGNITCARAEQVVDARQFLRVVTTGSRRGSDDAIGADGYCTSRRLWRGNPDRCRPDGADEASKYLRPCGYPLSEMCPAGDAETASVRPKKPPITSPCDPRPFADGP